MLSLLPAILFAIVILATLLHGRAVAATSGASAWAFRHARGAQRTTGLAFALSIAALAFGTALLALGRIDPAPAAGRRQTSFIEKLLDGVSDVA